MPLFKVQAPDGQIIKVDAPEGATEQQAIAFAASQWRPVDKSKLTPILPSPASPGSELNLDSSGQPIPPGMNEAVNHLMPADVQQKISEQSLTPTRSNAYALANQGLEEAAAAHTNQPEQPTPLPHTGLISTPAAQQEALMEAAARSGNVSPEFKESVPGWPLEKQLGAGMVSSMTAGMANRISPELGAETQAQPQTGMQEVARGAGDLVGFLNSPEFIAAKGTVALAKGLEHVAGESFVKALAKDVVAQSATLGLATGVGATGQALDANNTEDAAKILANASLSGAGMGAIFGGFARVLPDNTAAQVAGRIIGVNATMDALNGTNPDDQRSLEKKLFDYGLNTVFALSGAGRTTGGWIHDAASTKVEQASTIDRINAADNVDDAISASNQILNESTQSVADKLQAIRPLEIQNGIPNEPVETAQPAVGGETERDIGEGNANVGLPTGGIVQPDLGLGGIPNREEVGNRGIPSGAGENGIAGSTERLQPPVPQFDQTLRLIGTHLNPQYGIESYRAELPLTQHQHPYMLPDGEITNPNLAHHEVAVDAGYGEEGTDQYTEHPIRALMRDTGFLRLMGAHNELNVEALGIPTEQQFAGIKRAADGRTINFDLVDEQGKIRQSITADNVGTLRRELETGGQNAIQEPSTGGVLQYAQERAGEAGGERGRVEQGVQGAETSAEGNRPVSKQGTQVNIGLATNDGKGITADQVRGELDRLGIKVLNSEITQSATEPTFVATLSRPMTADEAHDVSTNLNQEAIAQMHNGVGELYGPGAEAWKPFNSDYLIEPTLKTGEVPTIVGTHFSAKQRPVLSGSAYGTGAKGAEARRLAQSEDSRIKNRIAFYVDEGKGAFPEQGVGNVRHDVPLSNLYDAANNPLRLPSSPNEFESAVLDHGFDGYYVKEGFARQGVAVLLGKATKSVRTQEPAAPAASKIAHPSTMLGMVDEAQQRLDAYQKAREALGLMPSGMRKATERMMERAEQGKRGGLVMGTENDNLERAATELAKLHGTKPEDEAQKLQEQLQRSIAPSAQTEKPEFKRWFGNSKVVDAQGNPQVVYHGTQADFSEFDPKKMYSGEGASQSGSGFYFTTKPESASNYAQRKGGEGGRVMPVYLSIKHPLYIDFRTGEVFGAEHQFTRNEVKKILMLAPDIKSKEDSPLLNFGDVAYEGFNKVLNEAIDAYAGSNNFAALRNDFFGNNYAAWLDALHTVIGYDGAYSKLDDGTIHYVAWKPEQIKSAIGNRGTFNPNDPNILMSRGQSHDIHIDKSSVHDGPGFLKTIIADNEEDAYAIAGELTGRVSYNGRNWQVITPSDVPSVIPAMSKTTRVSGFYHPELGTIFINADKVPTSEIPSIIMHEVQHAADDPALNAEVMRRMKLAPKNVAAEVPRSTVGAGEIFYSQLGRTIDTIPDKIFSTGKNVALWLNANAAKNQVKKDELYWSGINDWLNAQGKVSKIDVQNFLKEGGVQVKEVMLGQPFDKAEREELNSLSEIPRRDRTPEQLARIRELQDASDAEGSKSSVKFASYQLPGGENYRELLLTLPTDTGDAQLRRMELAGIDRHRPLTPSEQAEYDRLNSDKELSRQNFKSSHFDQPNILAHIRFNERTDAEGRKVLFLEELQSDWGQKGKKEGFQEPELRVEKSSDPDADPDTYDVIVGKTRIGFVHAVSEAVAISKAKKAYGESPLGRGVPSAPFVTDTKSWTALALKKMIAYAADNGFDRVAWTNGEQQAARYDLSKQISSVELRPYGKEKVILSAFDLQGRKKIDEITTKDKLPDFIGKEATDKLLNAPVKKVSSKIGELGDTEDVQEIHGLDLKVGGEGMKGYYDQIVPQVANDILKKIGGGKVSDIDFGASRKDRWEELRTADAYGKLNQKDRAELRKLDSIYNVERQPEELNVQQGFTITPEMRAKILSEGLPLFSRAEDIQSAKQSAKSAIRAELQAGRIDADTAFRGTSENELRAIANTGKLQLGENFEGHAGISAALVHDGDFPVYGRGVGYLVPEEAGKESGYPGEVYVDPKTDPRSLRYVVDGKVMSFDQMKDAVTNLDFMRSEAQGQISGDIYARVLQRMYSAGEAGNPREATSYLVEEAMKMGQTAGHSRLDEGFWGWAQKALPPSVVNVLKQWIANIRAAMYKRGIMLKTSDLKVDDFLAIARSNMKELSTGQREATRAFAPVAASKEEIPKESTKTSNTGTTARINTLQEKAKSLIDGMINEIQMAVTPMAAGSAKYKAIAKDYANAERSSRWQWAKFDEILRANYSKEDLQKMWEAADEQNVLLQEGKSTAGKGLDRLTQDQRKTMDTLHNYGEELLQRAKDTGMFTGEGLPYWTPRMAVMIGDDGEYSLPKQQGIGGAKEGRNITTTAQSLKQRKYLTTAETEAAMKAKFGEGAEVAKDIRAMPMAMARLERAIAGRELINQIKKLGNDIGEDLVSTHDQDGYFTIDHPAFKTYRPRFVEVDGKMVPAIDQNGDTVMERNPLYLRKDLEGPLKAIMSEPSGKAYLGLMSLKGKVMSVVMYSPLIHNAVEYGRALPMLPGKMLTFQVYFEGNKAKRDPVQMHEAISNGLVPIGGHGGIQDITGVMENPNLAAGRGIMAKTIGGAVGLVNKSAGEAVKRGIDYAGEVWHNKLLWDRIGDLQMGLYTNVKRIEMAKLIKSGMDEQSANGVAGKIAAHMANRYAGALPNESMSAMSRKVANLTLFSRSFTIGNLGVMKDIFTGLPTDVQAQIKRDYGDLALRTGVDIARRKAVAAFIIDIGLMYALNSLTQDAFDYLKRDKSLSDIEKSYADRFAALWHKTQDNPLSVLNSPLDSMASLTSTVQNEPGKEDRVLYGYDKTGTGIYVRMPMGKIGEEFIGWTTKPLEMMKRKESTFLRPIIQTFENDKGFGRRVYNPDEPGIMGTVHAVGNIVKNFMTQQIPNESLQALINTASDKGTEMDAYKIVGPLLGLTFSKGAPGGPAVGLMYKTEHDRRERISDAMPAIKEQINAGNTDAAVQQMVDLGMTRNEIKLVLGRVLNPSAKMTPYALRKFESHADEESKAKMGQYLSH